MRRTLILLIALVCLCAGTAQGFIVRNGATIMADTLCVTLNSMDSAATWTSHDSAIVFIRCPRGVSFRDSGTVAALTGMKVDTIRGRFIYSWVRAAAAVDSNYGPGQYSGLIMIQKNGQTNKWTPRFFEFDILGTRTLDSAMTLAADSAATARSVWNDAITTNANRKVAVQLWRGGINVPYFTGAGADTLIPVLVANTTTAERIAQRNSMLNAKMVVVTSAASDSGFISTGLTEASNVWNNYVVMIVSGSHNRKSVIVKRSTLNTSDTIIFRPKLSSAIAVNDTVLMVPSWAYWAAAKVVADSTASVTTMVDSFTFADSSRWQAKAGSTLGKLVGKAATSATATVSPATAAMISDSVANKRIFSILERMIAPKIFVCSGTPTTTKTASANLTEGDNYWTDQQVVMLTGAAIGQSVRITGMYTTGDSITFQALTVAPSAGDTGAIWGMISEAGSSTGVDSLKAYQAAVAAINATTISASALKDSLNKYQGITMGVVAAGSTTDSINTSFTEAITDYWKYYFCVMIKGGMIRQGRPVTSYNGTTKALRVTAFTANPALNDTFLMIPMGASSTGGSTIAASTMDSIADFVLNRNLDSGEYVGANFARTGTKIRLAGDSTRYATPGDVWKQKWDSGWNAGSMGEYMRLRSVAAFAMSLKPAGVFGNYITDPLFLSYDTATTFSAGSGPYTINTYGTTVKALVYDLPETYKALSLSCTGGAGKDSIKVASRRATQFNPGVYQYGVSIKRINALAIDSLWVTLTDSTAGAATLIDTFRIANTELLQTEYREFSEKVTLTVSSRLNVQVRMVGTGGQQVEIAYLLLRGGGGADPAAIATAVWNADTATYNNVAASYGAILATPAYVQGAAASVTDSSILTAIRNNMEATGSTTLRHYTALAADSGAAVLNAPTTAQIITAIQGTSSLLSAQTLIDIGNGTWNRPFNTAFTVGSMGDTLNNPSYVGNVYSIGGPSYTASAAALRDMFLSTARASMYLSKLDIVGDNGTDGSFRVVNSGGPGATYSGALNFDAVRYVATGTGRANYLSSQGGSAWYLGSGTAPAATFASSSNSAIDANSGGSYPTVSISNTGTGVGEEIVSGNNIGQHIIGATRGLKIEGGDYGAEYLGVNAGSWGLWSHATLAANNGYKGALDTLLKGGGTGGSGSGADTVAIKALATNNPSLFYGPTSSGTGADTIRILAIDTALTPDTSVQQVKLTIQNSTGAAIATAYTGSDGSQTFNLDSGTYTIVPFKAGYYFTNLSITVTGNRNNVRVLGYNAVPNSVCRVWGTIVNWKSYPKEYATLTFTFPDGINPSDSSILFERTVEVTTDANGYFAVDLIRSSLLQSKQWTVTVSGANLSPLRRSFTVPDATAYRLRW